MLGKYTVLYFFLVLIENQYSCEVDSIIRNNDVYGDMLNGVGLNCIQNKDWSNSRIPHAIVDNIKRITQMMQGKQNVTVVLVMSLVIIFFVL